MHGRNEFVKASILLRKDSWRSMKNGLTQSLQEEGSRTKKQREESKKEGKALLNRLEKYKENHLRIFKTDKKWQAVSEMRKVGRCTATL